MAEAITFKPRRPCPVCRKPSQPKFHPFCSARCAQVDLNRWLGGNYAIKSEEEEDGQQPAGQPGETDES